MCQSHQIANLVNTYTNKPCIAVLKGSVNMILLLLVIPQVDSVAFLRQLFD